MKSKLMLLYWENRPLDALVESSNTLLICVPLVNKLRDSENVYISQRKLT